MSPWRHRGRNHLHRAFFQRDDHPGGGRPGETIDLEMTGMPIHRWWTTVIIDGADRLGGANFNTDAKATSRLPESWYPTPTPVSTRCG